MSANRERNFNRPSLENHFSGRERYRVRVRDRSTGKIILETGSSGEAIVSEGSVIVKEDCFDTFGKKHAFSLKNVDIEGDRIRHAQGK
ncbi:hypothetical protein A2696_01835 [Candidatus Curtissbacteria bacterium RIFCSPHIGHO2_01_FULL_41_13]|uniref:Uncharacterized protein n=1 Tax=Candidatus Curtissbacteria bacterium RIFCSPHIGHO2_01_FULL_41_13 TaxID=1797745 RepID=A0A1F5G1J3_9BACT|nr:MAG: hypothetical protein A2696_01835 [Candidatus Curtissbacteria bacterium RIFCSPHIGHO2_01_FULL_41_13]